jgi:hypothetical protein
VPMFQILISWFTGRRSSRVEALNRESPRPAATPTSPATVRTSGVVGKLTHRKIYTFGATPSGQSSTSCPLCRESGQHVFSIAVDSDGNQHKCCLRCLTRLGGREQVEIAAKRSRYARRVLECFDALDQLQAEFPDPSRRPFGEKSLRAEIALPFMGYAGIEGVLKKIKNRKWTAYDLARRDRID